MMEAPVDLKIVVVVVVVFVAVYLSRRWEYRGIVLLQVLKTSSDLYNFIVSLVPYTPYDLLISRMISLWKHQLDWTGTHYI